MGLLLSRKRGNRWQRLIFILLGLLLLQFQNCSIVKFEPIKKLNDGEGFTGIGGLKSRFVGNYDPNDTSPTTSDYFRFIENYTCNSSPSHAGRIYLENGNNLHQLDNCTGPVNTSNNFQISPYNKEYITYQGQIFDSTIGPSPVYNKSLCRTESFSSNKLDLVIRKSGNQLFAQFFIGVQDSGGQNTRRVVDSFEVNRGANPYTLGSNLYNFRLTFAITDVFSGRGRGLLTTEIDNQTIVESVFCNMEPGIIEFPDQFLFVNGNNYYVSPSGLSTNNGSITQPWDLATALAQPAGVFPGDTIWVRGGTYSGTFNSSLNGNASRPIVVRAYPGENPIIDAGSTTLPALQVVGQFTWFEGLEIFYSNTKRTSAIAGSNPADILRGPCVKISDMQPSTGVGTKIINMNLHDCLNGLESFSSAENLEVYGNRIYYNGFQGPTRSYGVGIKAGNVSGSKYFRDNVIFNNYSDGMSMDYQIVRGMNLEGNMVFSNGILSNAGSQRNILLGNNVQETSDSVLIGNMTYYNDSFPGVGSNDFMGCTDLYGVYNRFVGGFGAQFTNCFLRAFFENLIYGNFDQSTVMGSWGLNSVFFTSPIGYEGHARTNIYDPKKAIIEIYNWSPSGNTYNLDVSNTTIKFGDSYEIYDLQNINAGSIATGTFNGHRLSVPTTSNSVKAPIGTATPPHTNPIFLTFLLVIQ